VHHAQGPPLAGRALSTADYLAAEHLVPTYAVGQRGVIDLHLARERLKRNVVAYVPYFGLVPYLLLETDMLFSSPRIFAEHCAKMMPLTIAEAPIDFPRMSFYLLWHDRSHYEECRWFREQITSVARSSPVIPRPGPAPVASGPLPTTALSFAV
jgi:DNA-binding transcriptional LysR family regulator